VVVLLPRLVLVRMRVGRLPVAVLVLVLHVLVLVAMRLLLTREELAYRLEDAGHDLPSSVLKASRDITPTQNG
jgi:hypothetical protein